jgi:hypothetical protein
VKLRAGQRVDVGVVSSEVVATAGVKFAKISQMPCILRTVKFCGDYSEW